MKFLSFILIAIFSLVSLNLQAAGEGSDATTYQAPVYQAPSINDSASRVYQEAHNTGSLSDFPRLHPLIVHFPIVLIILAFLTQIVSFIVFKKELSWVAMVLITLGFVGAYLATNQFHGGDPDLDALSDIARQTFETHDKFAHYTVILSGVAALLKIISHFLIHRKWWSELVVVIVMLGTVACLHTTGEMGARLVHIDAIGVQGNRIQPEGMDD